MSEALQEVKPRFDFLRFEECAETRNILLKRNLYR